MKKYFNLKALNNFVFHVIPAQAGIYSSINWLRNNWGLLLVVIIGGLLRFYRLSDMATFGGDQGSTTKMWPG